MELPSTFSFLIALALIVCTQPTCTEDIGKDELERSNINTELAKLQSKDLGQDIEDSHTILPSSDSNIRNASQQDVAESCPSDGHLSPRGNALSCFKGGLCGAQVVHDEDDLPASVSIASAVVVNKTPYSKQQAQDIRQGLQVFLENEAVKLSNLHHSNPKDSKAYDDKMRKELASLRILFKFRLANRDMDKTIKDILSRKGTDRVLRELRVPRQALAPFLRHMREKEIDSRQRYLKRWADAHRTREAIEAQWDEITELRRKRLADTMGRHSDASRKDLGELARMRKNVAELEMKYVQNEIAIRKQSEEFRNILKIYESLERASSISRSLLKKMTVNWKHRPLIFSHRIIGRSLLTCRNGDQDRFRPFEEICR